MVFEFEFCGLSRCVTGEEGEREQGEKTLDGEKGEKNVHHVFFYSSEASF